MGDVRGVLTGLAAGLLFGLGLTVSGMIDPARVLAFLDVAGPWDPAVGLVMAGAIPVAAAGYVLSPRPGPAPVGRIDRRLLGGAAIFGLGWGLIGYCPGPALASLGFAGAPTWLFVAAMLAGMAAMPLISGWLGRAESSGPGAGGGSRRATGRASTSPGPRPSAP